MMNIKAILLSAAACVSLAASAQNLTVTANLPMLPNGETVYLVDAVTQVKDSTVVKDHQFVLTCETDSGSFYIVQIGKETKDELSFYMHMEPGEVHVSGGADVTSIRDAEFTGSPFVDSWKQMHAYMDEACGGGFAYFEALGAKALQAQQIGDTKTAEAVLQQYADYIVKGVAAAKAWLAQYPDDSVSSYVVNMYLFNKIPLNEVQALLNELGPNGRNSRLATLMLNMQSAS